jgi:phosphoglycerol transferase MdoB-like AlkP superfamily enzyme
MASVLKKNGYYTVGIYPLEGSFFNARKSYSYYDFDEFLDAEELNLGNWDNSDTYLFRKIFIQIDRLKKKTSKPLFVFMLTMNNHGPHNRYSVQKFIPKKSKVGSAFLII